MGQAALKAASCKVMKHENTCIENQHVFIPFAFDTFGFLAPEAVDLLNRVQRVMHSNVMTPKSMDVVFKMVGFVIQKGVAAQLVARLPSTSISGNMGTLIGTGRRNRRWRRQDWYIGGGGAKVVAARVKEMEALRDA
ncbi:hypothetical protein LXL04_020062 [Taraxacum kok-saghyz]